MSAIPLEVGGGVVDDSADGHHSTGIRGLQAGPSSSAIFFDVE